MASDRNDKYDYDDDVRNDDDNAHEEIVDLCVSSLAAIFCFII